jgi:hypothetical protein
VSQHGLALRVVFDLPQHAHTGPFESEVDPADTGKQTADCDLTAIGGDRPGFGMLSSRSSVE